MLVCLSVCRQNPTTAETLVQLYDKECKVVAVIAVSSERQQPTQPPPFPHFSPLPHCLSLPCPSTGHSLRAHTCIMYRCTGRLSDDFRSISRRPVG